LARAFLWEHSCKRLKVAQLLGRHGAFLTWHSSSSTAGQKLSRDAAKFSVDWPLTDA
jgi:hypothetical protein